MSGVKPAPRWLVMIAFLFAALSASLLAQTHDVAPGAAGLDYRSEVEKQTFFLINEYRKTHDMPPLAWDEIIAKVARAHSKDMATGEVDFGHEGFRDRVVRLKSEKAGFSGAGENVLMTTDMDEVAKSAVALWLRSPHHLENIRGDYNYSGVGVWQDKDGALFFTQIFMKFAPPAAQAETAADPAIITPFGMLAAPNTRARP